MGAKHILGFVRLCFRVERVRGVVAQGVMLLIHAMVGLRSRLLSPVCRFSDRVEDDFLDLSLRLTRARGRRPKGVALVTLGRSLKPTSFPSEGWGLVCVLILRMIQH